MSDPKALELYLQKLTTQHTLQEAYAKVQKNSVIPSRLNGDHRTYSPSAPILTFDAFAAAYAETEQTYKTGVMVGAPGGGMSTILTALTFATAQRTQTTPTAPIPVRVVVDEQHRTFDALLEQAFWENGLTLQGNVLQEFLHRSQRPLFLLLDVASTLDPQTAVSTLDTILATLDTRFPNSRWLVGVREDIVWQVPMHWQRYTYYQLHQPAPQDAADDFMDRLDPVVRAMMEQLMMQTPALAELLRRPAVAEMLSRMVKDIPTGAPRTVIVHFLRSLIATANKTNLSEKALWDTLATVVQAGQNGVRASGKNAHLLPVLRQAGLLEQVPADKPTYRVAGQGWADVLSGLEWREEPSVSSASVSRTTPPATVLTPQSLTSALSLPNDLEQLNSLEKQIALTQAELYHRKAQALRDDKRLKEALSQIRAALGIAPDRADFVVTQGILAVESGQYDEGVMLLSEHLPYAASGEGYQYLGHAYTAKGWHNEAYQAYDRASGIEWHGQATAAANAAALAPTPDVQRRLWEKAIALDEHRPDWHVALGTLRAAANDIAGAQKSYEHALVVQRTHPYANHALGMLHYQQGNIGAARQHLLIAMTSTPDRSDPMSAVRYSDWLVDLGQVLEAATDVKAAEESYSQAIHHNPRNAVAYAHKGMLLRRMQRFPDAQYVLQESLILDSEQGQVHFELGLLHEAQGQYADAVQSYRRAAQLLPTLAIIRAHLGKAHRELGDAAEASHWLQRALDLDPTNSPALTEMGLLAEGQGDFAHAARLYADAITAMPQNVQAIFRQGVMRLQLEQAAEAIPLLEEAAKLMPDQAEVHGYHAEALRRVGANDAAMTAYRKAIRLDENNLAYRFAFAQHASELQRWEDARLALDVILEREPRNTAAHVLLGNLLRKKGALTKALESYKKACALEPYEADLYLPIADLYAEMGQLDDALTTLQHAIRAAGETAELLGKMARLYEEQGMMESACEQLQLALELDPSHESSRRHRADLHTTLGHRKEAYHDWQTLLEYNPNYHEAYYGIGWLQESDGLLHDALISYSQAITAAAPAEAWWLAHGRVAIKTGQSDAALPSLQRVVQRDSVSAQPHVHAEAHYLLASLTNDIAALTHLEKALELDKRNPAYHLAFAQRHEAAGKRQAAFAALELARQNVGSDGAILADIAAQYDEWGYNHEAIQSYVRAVEFVPDSAPLLVRLAILQRGMDKTTEAREALEEAIRRRADYAPAYRELGHLYAKEGATEPAIHYYELALEQDPDDLATIEPLANLALAAQDYDAAEQLLKQGLSMGSKNLALLTLLGALYTDSDRPAHAQDVWRKAIELAPQEAHFHRENGRAHWLMEQYDDAKKALNSARRLDATDPETHWLMGQVSEARGDLPQAISEYQTAMSNDPSDARYPRTLATLFIQQQKWDEALHILREAHDLNANDSEVAYLMALCYEHMGPQRAAAAIDRARAALQQEPNNPRYLQKMGDLFAQQGQWAEAQQVYQSLHPLESDDRALVYAAGMCAINLGHYQDAVAAFRRAVSLDAFDPRANRLLAESIKGVYQPVLLAHLAQAEFTLSADFAATLAEGLDAAQRAYDYGGGDNAATKVLAYLYLLKDEPHTAFSILQHADPALFGRALFGELDGLVYLATGDATTACDAFRYAVARDKENPLLWLAYAVGEEQCGNLSEALHFVKDAVSLAPNEGIYKYAYARILLKTELQEQGKRRVRKIMAEAIALRGDIPSWHLHLGELAAANFDYDAAHAAYNTALAVLKRYTPDDKGVEGMIMRAQALCFQQQGKVEQAVDNMAQAIECFSSSPVWHEELAIMHMNMGNYPAAETHYRIAIQLQSDKPDTRLALAHLLESAGNGDAARTELLQLTEKWNTNVLGWCQLGRLYLQTEQNDDAFQAFSTAHRLDHANPLPLLGLADYYGRTDQPNEERQQILQAYQLAPENADVLTQLGRLYKNVNDLDGAEKFFHAALQQDSRHLYANYGYADLLMEQGHYDAAIGRFQAVVSLSPASPWAWVALGEAYAKKRDLLAACDCYKEALKYDPTNKDYWFNLGCLYFKRQDYDEAIPTFNKAEKMGYRADKVMRYKLEARAKLMMTGVLR